MDKQAKFIPLHLSPFTIRIIGALVGSVGFFFIAYKITVIGTALVGMGSVIIAAGESQ